MSTSLRITADEYDRMIAKGAFEGMGRRTKLIQGELRQESPVGPVHVFTSPQGKPYLNHCVVTAAEAVSPSCKPDAKLFLAELFI